MLSKDIDVYSSFQHYSPFLHLIKRTTSSGSPVLFMATNASPRFSPYQTGCRPTCHKVATPYPTPPHTHQKKDAHTPKEMKKKKTHTNHQSAPNCSVSSQTSPTTSPFLHLLLLVSFIFVPYALHPLMFPSPTIAIIHFHIRAS